jgi:diacylglycerol kinase (ATP)
MKKYRLLDRLYHASCYSLNGLAYAFKKEQAFELETVVLVLLTAILWMSRLSPFQAILLIGAWLSVMALELINSAVERVFDLIDKDFNPHVKAGKDMLSAAVFLLILFNALLWGTFLLAS